MSTYWPAPRRQTPLTSPAYPPPNRRQFSIDQIASLPTYIFPSPSSAPPSPNPSHSSILSEQSDTSFSIVSFSEFGSPDNSPILPQVEHYGSAKPIQRQSLNSPSDSWTDVQSLTRKLEDSLSTPLILSDQKLLESGSENLPNGEAMFASGLNTERLKVPLQHPLDHTASGQLVGHDDLEQKVLHSSHRPPPLLEKSPPLLSLLSSLLGLDNSTIDLLRCSTPSTSIFFPTDFIFHPAEGSSGTTSINELGVHPESAHGVEKLFLVIAPERDHFKSVHQGMLLLDSMPTNEFCLKPVWLVVTDFVMNGCRLLHRFSNGWIIPSSS